MPVPLDYIALGYLKEYFIMIQRAKVTTTTPMTPELFMQWKKKKMEEREANLGAQQAERGQSLSYGSQFTHE